MCFSLVVLYVEYRHSGQTGGFGSNPAFQLGHFRKQIITKFNHNLKQQIAEFEHIGIKHVQDSTKNVMCTHQIHDVEQLHPIRANRWVPQQP